MKKNLTFINFLAIIALSFISLNTLQAQQCLPAGPVAVSGVADVNTGATFNFPAVPVGTVIELVTTGPNDVFTIELCGTNADGWLDGDHDSSCHILDANSATATYIQNIEDGCTGFAAGQNGWGPDIGTWAGTAAGTFYLYITEWNAGGTANCEVTSGQTYNVDITIASAGPCVAGTLTSPAAQTVCPAQAFVIDLDGTQVSDGGFYLGWDNTNTGGTGSTGGPFNQFGIFQAEDFPISYDSDLNGVLSGQTTPLPPFAGTWEFAVYALDAAGAICDQTATSTTVTFLDAADAGCASCATVDAGVVTSAAVQDVDACAAGTFTIDLDGSQTALGGYLLGFNNTNTNGTGGLEGPLTLTGLDDSDIPLTYDNDLNGILSGQATPLNPLAGTWELTVYALNGNGDLCDSTTVTTVHFNSLSLAATAMYDCATGSVVVDVTGSAAIAAATGTVDLGADSQPFTGAGSYTFLVADNQTHTVSVNAISGTCDETVNLFVIADCSTLCAGATEGTTDGGFEGAAGSAWTEVSTDPAGADTGFGIVDTQLSLEGAQAAWFGGWGTDGSITSLSQSVTIPTGVASATFSFWALEIGDCVAGDVLEIDMDGAVVFTQDGTNANCGSNNWHKYTVDLAAYADGMAHTLKITYNQLGQVANSNLFMDEASLVICPCPSLSLSTSSTDETCSDAMGTATVTVTGGTGASYEWSNGAMTATATGLSAGDYLVTVTDIATGCTATTGVAIGNVVSTTALTATTSSTDENCGSADGTASVDMVNGGSGNYTYAWVNGETTAMITGLTAGTYPVTITDSDTGCSGTATVAVASAGGPNVAVDASTNATCNGATDGSIMITATGGDGTYTYAWSNGETTDDLSGLAAGVYTCTVTDGAAACPFVVNATITEPTAISMIADNVMNVSCNAGTDGAIMISVSGGTAPYTFQWSNGETTEDISGLVAGDYTGTITDANGCDFVAGPVTITEPTAIAVAVDAINGSTGTDGSIDITVTGGTAPYTFSWDNGALTEDLVNLMPGDYIGTITDANGCMLVAGPVSVDDWVSVEDLAGVSSFTMNPNPTSGDVRIAISLEAQYDVQLEIFDVTGRNILSDNRSNTTDVIFNVDLGNFANGVYFAKITVDGNTFTERIIKSN